jgi:hypothetical protein
MQLQISRLKRKRKRVTAKSIDPATGSVVMASLIA